MDNKTKTYLPKASAKEVQTKFGQVIKLGFNVKELIAFATQHANEKGYLNVDVVPRREVSQYGETHSLVLNDWKPSAQAAPKPAANDDDEPAF